MKPTYWKSWADNLLMWTDLASGLSFEVKRWFTGFVHCLSGGYNLHWFSDVLGLVNQMLPLNDEMFVHSSGGHHGAYD